ncbi:MAG: tRNA1(Val) (adenine(37)-N6)-methyltransferase [Oscillospiraceae bacterium]|nr:tRNA1(Val) (adenine(37)-N6)-methyltransferase [Oscillospiraceae bacterium]
MKIQLKENEEIEELGYNNWKIIQNKKEFCFGMDSIVLSDFAKDIATGSIVLDLGTGTGIIGILLCGKSKLKKIIGIEIQEQVANMAMRSIQINNLQHKFTVMNEDINNLNKVFDNQSIDAIVTNPPYKKENSGRLNENPAKLISRHECKCNLEGIVKQSSYLLKDHGTLYMVHRPERLADILVCLRNYKIEPKSIRFVHSREESEAKLVLVKAVKNAKPFLKVDKPLRVYDKENNYTTELLEIYGSNKRGEVEESKID